MRTFTGFLIALILVAPAPARASILTTNTPPIIVVDNVGQIIRFGQTWKAPPFPKVGSSSSSYTLQYEVHRSSDYTQEMYVTVTRGSCNVGFGFQSCYLVETTGQVGSVRTDPIRTVYAFPGDSVDVVWYGPGDPVETAHGTPYWHLTNDNASHIQSAAIDVTDDYAGPYVDGYMHPWIEMRADSTWSTMFPPAYEHNAWGDLPAATEASNVCRQTFLDDYMTADQVMHFAYLVQPTYKDPAFVNYSGTSIPGANIAVSTTNISGWIWNMVTTYGGQ